MPSRTAIGVGIAIDGNGVGISKVIGTGTVPESCEGCAETEGTENPLLTGRGRPAIGYKRTGLFIL